MTIIKKITYALFAGMLALSASTAAQAHDQTRNTVIGAGLGGATGALISEGDPWVILGGAAVGGVLGNIITDDRGRGRDHYWSHDRGRNNYYKRASYRGHDKHRGKKHWKKKHRH